VTEIGDVEVTLDDCWSLDLNKRDRWRSVLEGTMMDMVWKGDIEDDGSEMTGEGDSDSDDDDGSDEEEEDEEEERAAAIVDKDNKKKSKDKSQDKSKDKSKEKEGKSSKKKDRGTGGGAGLRAEVQTLRELLPLRGEDDRLYPLSGQAVKASAVTAAAASQGGPVVETLRDFYSRNSDHWKQQAVDQWQAGLVNIDGDLIPVVSVDKEGSASERAVAVAGGGPGLVEVRLSEKEVKRIAFCVCQRAYSAVLPVVTRMAELEEGMVEEEGQRGRGSSKRR
jgi:hypothetical protein